jgi:hypothetical protein
MDPLRLHPRFVPLPVRVEKLEALEDALLFHQDSWRWDAIHVGRCTMSQAVAALEFLENMAGEILNVPPSWRRGGRGAYQRLCHKPLRTLEDFNRVLCHIGAGSSSSMSSSDTHKITNPWSPLPITTADENSSFPFAARYDYETPEADLLLRKKLARKVCTDWSVDFPPHGMG